MTPESEIPNLFKIEPNLIKKKLNILRLFGK